MKPFVINRSSWHYKFNKFMVTRNNTFAAMKHLWEPKHSDFCSYWRATILHIIAAIFISALILIFMIAVILAIYLEPVAVAIGTGVVIVGIASGIGIVYLTEKLKNRSKNTKKNESLIMQKYRAHKSKICPMVEFEE